jgi:transposase
MTAAAASLVISPNQRAVLERIAKSRTAAHREVQRARVLLAAGQGEANGVIAAAHGVTANTVRAWRAAFEREGLTNWGKVAKGRGRKPSIPEDTIARIVELTNTTRPKGHTQWSCRTMAAEVGVSKDTVQRVWSELGLQPHRVEHFKVSNDPRLREKVVDVVGLYLNPPAKAVVLCMDEKSQIQALDRTQATLPMK